MKINSKTQFIATLISDDKRTDFKKGRIFYPKGVYWNGKDVILVGDKNEGHTIRLSFPANVVDVEVI